MKRFTNHPEEWGEFIDIKLSNKKIDAKRIEDKNVYIQEKYPKVYPIFERVYIKSDKQELINMDNEIKEYCNKN